MSGQRIKVFFGMKVTHLCARLSRCQNLFGHKIFGGNSFAKNLFKIKQILRLKGFFYGVFILKPLHIVLSMQTFFF